jgi:hypothetical protein
MNNDHLITNRFEIKDLEKDLLGRGGMGDVYRAADTQTGKILEGEVLALLKLRPK